MNFVKVALPNKSHLTVKRPSRNTQHNAVQIHNCQCCCSSVRCCVLCYWQIRGEV